MEYLATFFGNFLILLILAVALFFFALRAGRSLLISLILALYVGFALFTVFPFTDSFIVGETSLANAVSRVVLFGVLTAIPFILLRRASGSTPIFIHPIGVAVLALASGGFILALGYHVLNIAAIVPLTPALDALFAPDKYFFWWFIAPLVGIFVTTK